MTGQEHYEAAERLLSAASFFDTDPSKDREACSVVTEASLLTAQAHVHALLAVAVGVGVKG